MGRASNLRPLALVRDILTRIIWVVITVWVLFPIWWAAIFSFKGSVDFFGSKIILFVQFHPTLANWHLEWDAFFAKAQRLAWFLGVPLTDSADSGRQAHTTATDER